MALLDVLVTVTTITALTLSVSLLLFVGPRRLWTVYRQGLLGRFRAILPYLLFLGLVLGLTSILRKVGPDISWELYIQIGSIIYDIEGEFVAWVQSFQTPFLTTYFSGIYIFGYVFLLIFPYLAYMLADDLTPYRQLTLAYALNYVFGLGMYILFIAYGPRNYEVGEGLLYNIWPQAQFLTSQVNVNTNVFPSLHASLSTTVALFAVRTRDVYRIWTVVAVLLAGSVCISTMYLGIHWGTDVVAGIMLAVLSVWLATRLHDQFSRAVDGAWDRIVTLLLDARQRVRSSLQ